MRTRSIHRWSLALLAMLLASPLAWGQTTEQLRRELEESRRMQERMMRMMQEQAQRIERLESQLSDAPPPMQERPLPGAPGGMSPGAGADTATGDTVTWPQITRDKGSSFRLYGFLRADAIKDSSRTNNTQVIGFARSEDNDAPPGIGAPSDADSFTLHARLTRLGLDLKGPEVAALLGAQVSGKVEVDFYGGGSESRALPRMRHAYAKLAWGDLSLLAGQTYDVISPLYPSANPDLAMWGAGNLGDRRPQFRVEWAPTFGDVKLNWRGAIGLPGANDLKDLDPGGTTGAGYRDGETSGNPVLQTRLALNAPWLWEDTRVEVGGWAHRAWDEPDTSFPLGAFVGDEDVFDSYAVGLDANVPLWEDKLWFKGEIWWGQNLSDVRGGIFQGVNTTTGDEIYARGGWAELGARFIPWWTLALGYSTDDPSDDDLNLGGRAANDVFYVTNRFKFDPVTIGFDWQNWRTDYVGFSRGTNDRFQGFIQYDF